MLVKSGDQPAEVITQRESAGSEKLKCPVTQIGSAAAPIVFGCKIVEVTYASNCQKRIPLRGVSLKQLDPYDVVKVQHCRALPCCPEEDTQDGAAVLVVIIDMGE
jgi:hypothetical protein